ncbi:MAG: hypothetical protein A2X12_00590 [Bacteroidetes bacterium GWE2_29_8]|nr:MAG: hypothetical protein A2X12_00590 [Bacteroidetes bacterium GWE2_29_8]OFY17435.1 MAG: hypothetical protein A2X02_00885 [Bacteroidetes bacterium GWF2_29_10]
MIKKLRVNFLYVLILLPLFLFSQNKNESETGNGNKYGVFMTFAKNGFEHKAGEVVTNVLKVVNNTDKEQNLILEISLPTGWSMIGKKERGLTLSAKDSAFFPIRAFSNSQIKGNINYVVSAILRNETGYVVSNSFWDIPITKISAWAINVPSSNIYFCYNTDTSSFKINITNDGSSDEAILLTMNPNRNLQLLIPGYDNDIPYTKVFYLPPGKDTSISYKVRKMPKDVTPFGDNYFDVTNMSNAKENTYNVRVFAQDEAKMKKGGKQWSGNLKFIQLQNLFVYNNFSYAILPLTFELNAYDLMGDNTFLNLDLYGTTFLPKNRTLNYRFSSNFTTNFFNSTSFLGNNRYLGYFTKYWFAEIGSVAGGYGVNGNGIRLGGIYKKHRLTLGFSRSPFFDFTKKADAVSYSLSHAFSTRFFSIGNSVSYSKLQYNTIQNTSYQSYLNLPINRNNNVNIGFGYTRNQSSISNIAGSQIYHGYNYIFGYSFGYKKFSISAGTNFGTSGYLYNSNFLNYNGVVNYNLSKKSNISFTYNHIESNPEISILGKYNNTFKNRDDLYSLLYTYSNKKYSISFNPFFDDKENYALRTQEKKLSIGFMPQLYKKDFKINFNLVSGYTKAVDYNVPDFFTSMFRVNIRYKKFTSSVRYNYGPYQFNELYNFLQSKTNMNSIFILNDYSYWFNKKKMMLKLNLNYRFETFYNTTRIYSRPEWFYYTNNGWRFNIYSYYNLVNKKGRTTNYYNNTTSRYEEAVSKEQQYHNWEFGLGIKKDLGIPISYKKYHTIEVIAFKDNNGNKIKDENEDGISNMLIRIKKNDLDIDTIVDVTKSFPNLITDNNGKSVFKNIPSGNYSIFAKPLSYNEGWFDGHEIVVPLDKNQIVYIPLNRGIKISGGIIFEKDKYSRLTDNFNLVNIKITAIDSLNNQYSALTDKNGDFALFVPKGKYVLRLNEAALGANFEYLQNNIILEFNNDIENYFVNFYVVEKARKMNVKKFNKVGNLEKESVTTTDAIKSNPVSGSAISSKQDTIKQINKKDVKDKDLEEPIRKIKKESVKTKKQEGIPEIVDITNTEQLSEKEIQEINSIIENNKNKPAIVEKQYDGDFVDSSMYDPFSKKAKKTEIQISNSNKKNINRPKNENIKSVNKPQVFKNNYGVQVRSSKYQLSDKFFTDTLGIKLDRNSKINEFSKDNEYKYVMGRFKNISQAEKFNDSLKKIHKDLGSFVINYNELNDIGGKIGEIVEIDENGDKLIYRIQISSSRANVEPGYFARKFNIIDKVYLFKMDGVNKYSIGNFSSYREAKEFNKQFQIKYNIKDSFITPYYNGKRITFRILEGLLKD